MIERDRRQDGARGHETERGGDDAPEGDRADGRRTGEAIGAGVAWPLSSLLQVQTFLFQVEPTNLAVYGLALGTLAAAGLLASAVPAFRAANIDPLVALRHE